MPQDKKRPPLRGMEKLKEKLKEYDEIEEKERRDRQPYAPPRPKHKVEHEGAVGTFEGLPPVAPRDFVPRDKSSRRRIPARARATFREKYKEA